MATTALTSWLPLIIPRVPMCPDFIIEEKVLWAARRLCDKTQLWENQALDAISLVANDPDYALSSSAGDIVSIDAVEIDGVPVRPTSAKWLDQRYRFWRDYTEARPHNYIVSMSLDEIRLVYTPSEALSDGLEIFVSLKPAEDATTVPDFLWRKELFRDAIKEGALSMLLGMRGMLWYEPGEAENSRIKFRDAVTSSQHLKLTGGTPMDIIADHESVYFA